MTAPLTPHDCDLRDFPSMLLDVARLRDSTLATNETPEACWAAVLLWCASWHQVPAASIPDSDQWQAKQAGYVARGRIDKAWQAVRVGALRGWVKCSDGRLYHPVVAEKALECWLSKLASRLSSGAGNAKRHKIAFDPKPIEDQIAASRLLLAALNPHSRALSRKKHVAPSAGLEPEPDSPPDGSPAGSPPGSQGKDKGTEGSSSEAIASAAADAPASVDNPAPPAPPPPPAPSPNPTAGERRAAWSGCGRWMVANGIAEATARELMGALLRDYADVALDAMVQAPRQESTPDPRAYLIATAKRLRGERATVPSDAAEKTRELIDGKLRKPTPEEWAASEAARQRVMAGRTSGAAAGATG